MKHFLLSTCTLLCFLTITAAQGTMKEVVVYTNMEEALKNPEKVESLALIGQKLKKLPKDIVKLKNLKYLDISRNQITALPAELGQLTKLEELNASMNKIEEIHDSVFTLKRLIVLKLRRNKLGRLPASIGNLNRLELLDLNNNPLWLLPRELKDCHALREIDLRNTDLPPGEREQLSVILPDVTIYLDNSCNCGPNN